MAQFLPLTLPTLASLSLLLSQEYSLTSVVSDAAPEGLPCDTDDRKAKVKVGMASMD